MLEGTHLEKEVQTAVYPVLPRNLRHIGPWSAVRITFGTELVVIITPACQVYFLQG